MGILDQAIIHIPRENRMKKFIKKLLGIEDKITSESLSEPKEVSTIPKIKPVKKSPKEIATEKKEPWVAVLDTHINKDNVRNGFFELDWNEYFVLQLKSNGYQGDTEESIVDQWFQELCRNIGSESDINMDRRGSGYINVNNLGDGRSEIS
jgi:hypothetical protein